MTKNVNQQDNPIAPQLRTQFPNNLPVLIHSEKHVKQHQSLHRVDYPHYPPPIRRETDILRIVPE